VEEIMKHNLKIIAALVIILIATMGFYSILTYPTTLLAFPVSFTIGADVEREQFNIPILHDWIEVEVAISSGSALWSARILDQEETVWSHTAVQGGQTTYNSGWIQLASGTYNFTFATAGAGSLSAEITVSSKGGFW
jgi:hypothetical protein